MTKQREAIIKAMTENMGHFTAEEIYQLSKKNYSGIVRATVYNNLNSMCDEHKIRRICQSGEPDRFDCNPAPHEHIICPDCGNVTDVHIEGMLKKIREGLNMPVSDYDLVIRCKCAACAAQ